jgi:hypothetical protein
MDSAQVAEGEADAALVPFPDGPAVQFSPSLMDEEAAVLKLAPWFIPFLTACLP